MRGIFDNEGSWSGLLASLRLREENGMSDITQARKELVARILEGDGRTSRAQRRGAFDNTELPEPLARLIDKVAKQAYKVTDEDIAAARASGLTEDQIFELVVCAAIGQATRQYDAALAALEAATEKERSNRASRDPR
jgi:alkylhydroperoxidase family enzyme